jgi:predicted TIM-barrel fold metal-dependent hydrolase
MVLTATRESQSRETRLEVIDCDVHNTVSSPKALTKYFPARWRSYHETYGPRRSGGRFTPQMYPGAHRVDSWPSSGVTPGSDREFLTAQLVDRYGLSYAILNPFAIGGSSQLNEEYGVALNQAINDWQVAEWLERDPRFRATIQVPFEYPAAAVREIDRLGDHPGFVQVGLLSRTDEPLGRHKYWPIYEAAVRHDLAIGMHFGAWGHNPGSGCGHPAYYFEMHTGQVESFQEVVASLVCEGVFEEFPTLRFVLIEGGFGWLPPLMWRLDRAWRLLGNEVPHLKHHPSEYIRRNIWFTTQPIEEPPRVADFEQLIADLQMDEKILFATDYPHWDFDSPESAIPATLPIELRQKIFAQNARQVYRLD